MEVYLLSLASLQKEEIQQKVVDLLSDWYRRNKITEKAINVFGRKNSAGTCCPFAWIKYLSSSLWKKRQALLF